MYLRFKPLEQIKEEAYHIYAKSGDIDYIQNELYIPKNMQHIFTTEPIEVFYTPSRPYLRVTHRGYTIRKDIVLEEDQHLYTQYMFKHKLL